MKVGCGQTGRGYSDAQTRPPDQYENESDAGEAPGKIHLPGRLGAVGANGVDESGEPEREEEDGQKDGAYDVDERAEMG